MVKSTMYNSLSSVTRTEASRPWISSANEIIFELAILVVIGCLSDLFGVFSWL